MNKKLEPCPPLSELMCNNPCACCSILAEEGRIIPTCYTCKVTIMRKELERRAATEANEPLTLEELREMDGKPVWLNVADGVWGLVDADDKSVTLSRGGYIEIEKLIGKVYRRPPEGGEGR